MNIKTKTHDSLWSILFLFAFVGTAFNAMAYSFEVDGIFYNYGDTEVTVAVTTSGYPKYSGDVVIPATIEFNGVTYTVTAIEEYAFDLCPNLNSVFIPQSVVSIGKMALTGCPNMSSLVVESGNAVYDSRENCNAVIETATNTLLFGCQNTFIPSSVTAIGYSAFDSSSITQLDIPNKVTTIADRAFAYCDQMTSINLGSGVTSIGYRIFEGSSKLESITVNVNNETFDSRIHCNAIIETASNTLVAGCKSTVIPVTVMAIGKYAFKGCYYLPDITIPNSVTAIGDSAFFDCRYSLTSIEIPNSVTSIGEYAFSRSALKTVIIPSTIVTIGNNAFNRCNLETVTCLAKTPPVIDASCFSSYNTTVLYVPMCSLGAYQTADVWQSFSTINGIDLPQGHYDVNCDGKVNITDVTDLINYLLSR